MGNGGFRMFSPCHSTLYCSPWFIRRL